MSVVLLGPGAKSYPTLPSWLSQKRSLIGFQIEGTKLVVLLTAAVSMAGLWFLVERTRTGKAMRAVAEDKEIAALMGIDVNRTIVKTFAVGGAMAGVAGILWGILFRSVTHMSGFLPGIKAFSAAVVGGIGNLGGAMAGGLSLGAAEATAPLARPRHCAASGRAAEPGEDRPASSPGGALESSTSRPALLQSFYDVGHVALGRSWDDAGAFGRSDACGASNGPGQGFDRHTFCAPRFRS